jgi:hypothetical protein
MKSNFASAFYQAAVIMAAATASEARGELLLRDDFAGVGNVDTTVWRLPFDTEGTFVGRTQFRGDPAVDMPQQGVAEPLASDGKVMELHLDTFSPIDPGNQFLGTDLLSKRNFARAGGLTFEARLRLKAPTAGGLVGGFFSYDVQRDAPPGSGNLVRDEIDFELMSNQAVGPAPTHDPFSNYWNDGPFTGPGAAGDGQFHNVAGLDLTQFQNYKVEWTPQHIKWYVNNALVRTQTSNVPNDPMKLHFNLWAPDSSFADAFNAALSPAASAGANQRYSVQVDNVEVNRLNTTVGPNLLVDPSFEEFNLTDITPSNGALTGTWLKFGNVFIEPDDIGGGNPSVPDMAPDGILMAKTFGPFHGGPDASGLLQNVPASPGQQFEARVKVQTASGDSIFGKQNFNTIAITFLNSAGNVIQEAFGAPTNIVDTNRKEFPLLDGRDPNMPQDQFVEGVVNAVAPAGTAMARVSLFFIQIANEGGASWFDDASLRVLTPNVVVNNADFDQNGIVDGADFLRWQRGQGGAGSLATGDANGDLQVNGVDLDAWKAQFGAPPAAAAAAAVPEPSAALLAVGTALAGATMRRRGARVCP